METYRDESATQIDRIEDATERLENGETLMLRRENVVVTARKRERGDFVVAHSKNGATRTSATENVKTAAGTFDRYVHENQN